MTEPEEKGRFARFSAPIDLRRLERELRRYLYWGVLFSALFHLFLVFLIHYEPPEISRRARPAEATRRIVTDIIEITPPKVRNPFMEWKGPGRTPRNRPYAVRNRYVMPGGSARLKEPPRLGGPVYRFRSEDLGIDADALIRAVVRGEIEKVGRGGIRDPEKFRLEPWREVKPTRKPGGALDRVSLRDEMLTVEDLNTGKYKGLVVLNPGDDRDIKGYVYIPAAVSGERLAPPRETGRVVTGIASILRQHTGIIARADSQFTLSSPGLARFPLLYIAAGAPFDLSPEERAAFGRYLRSGGFAFLEAYGGGNPNLPPRGAGSLKQMLRDALGSAGELRPVPNDHMLYHSFFDFPEGPPRRERDTETAVSQPAGTLDGVWLDGRLVAVYSEKGYGREWSRPSGTADFGRFGVNLVVYALTDAGGLSLRLVDDSGER